MFRVIIWHIAFLATYFLLPKNINANELWPTLSPYDTQENGEKDAALIIGIEDYLAENVPDVAGAQQNARDWYQFFIRTRKIPKENIQFLKDQDAIIESIKDSAEIVTSQVKEDGTLWIVFIGHGAPSKDGTDGVLIGADAQQSAVSLYARSLPQKELANIVTKGAQANTIFILDACFSGKTNRQDMFVPDLQPLLLVAGPPENVTILSAGSGGEFAGPLPGAKRPAFSYLILGAILGWGDRDRNGAVTAEEAVQYSKEVLQLLVKDRKQTPQLTSPNPEITLTHVANIEQGPDLSNLVLSLSEKTDEQNSSNLTTWGWSTLGIGTALTITSGVFIGLAVSKHNELSDSSLTQIKTEEITTDRDLYQTIGISSASVGLGLLTTGIILLLTDDRVGESTSQLNFTFENDRLTLNLSGQF